MHFKDENITHIKDEESLHTEDSIFFKQHQCTRIQDIENQVTTGIL